MATKPAKPDLPGAELREEAPAQDGTRAPDSPEGRLTRRRFIGGVGGSAVAAAIVPAQGAAPAAAEDAEVPSVSIGNITLNINGQTHAINRVEARTTLLEVLRNRLELTGAKPVCERASCGACTVLMDGKAVNACAILAMDAEGAEITTVEGLAHGNELHPVQQAFIEHDALMCGFCTPGFVVSLAGYLDQHQDATLNDIKTAVSGNLCRCGTYTRIFEAGETAARRMREGG